MVQAARSGKQNIVEGSLENSTESNLKLTGVARASYGELLEDFKDYLRQHNLQLWSVQDPRVWEIRKTQDISYATYKSYTTYMSYMNTSERFANLMVTLCYKQGFLLDRFLKGIQDRFIREGGFLENLFKKRREYQNNSMKI